jgi:GNAT superfamily N-acetyltransferase
MSTDIVLRTLAPEEWGLYRDLRLAALRDSPDAFGSTLEREEAFAPEIWRTRLEDAARLALDLPLMAFDGGRPVGLLWAKVDADDHGVVNLFQMWVDPGCRGRGVGLALLGRALSWAADKGASAVHLAVTAGDSPARRLYEREGFVTVSEEPLRPGSLLTAVGMRLELGIIQPIE